MKINNLLLNNIFLNKQEDIFEVGNIFKGQILDIFDEMIIIDIKGRGNVQAFMETDIELAKGDELSFLVTSSKGNKIMLKTLDSYSASKTGLDSDGKNNPIVKLLTSMNIKVNKLSIELAENLMKYNIPVSERNLTEGIKNLEKMLQLISLNEDEKIILLNPEGKEIALGKVQETDINIDKELVSSMLKEEPLKPESLLLKELPDANMVHIKNLIITNKSDYMDKKDLSPIINENFDIEITNKTESEFVKIISFFMKNNIKPSLNNIKNMMEFNKDPMEYAKDFKEINNLLDRVIGDNKTTLFSKLDSFDLNISLLKDSNKLEELKQIMRKVENSSGDLEKKELKNIENKIDFLVDLNKDLSYLILPLNYGADNLDGILTLLKKNKKKKTINEGINIYISLDTKNLGLVKISCQLVGSSISLKLSVQKDDLELFKSMEEQLVEKILSIGYILNGIDFLLEEEIQIIDTMVANPNPTYVLDIKV